MKSLYVFFILLLAIILVPVTFAHVPLTSRDNENIENATYISDPVKSWAIYTELHEGGEAQYYRLDMIKGQRLFVQIFTPPKSEFTPEMAIIGPLIESHFTGVEKHEHEIPDFITVPEGAEVMVVDTSKGQVTYEPFSPGSLTELAKVDLEAPATGTYYAAVYSLSVGGGKYGLAVGYLEVWSLDEWIRIPLSVLGVHQWEGQPLILILAPLLAIAVIGLILLVWRYNKGVKKLATLYGWLGSTAGLLYLGSGAIIVTQMANALSLVTVMPELGWITITIVFALMPIIIGIVALRLSINRSGKVTVRERAYLFIIGVVALFTWSGLLVGPALAFLASFSPHRKHRSS